MSRIGPVQFRINHLLFWLTPLAWIPTDGENG
jgi:hypothetical protein